MYSHIRWLCGDVNIYFGGVRRKLLQSELYIAY